LQGYSWMLPGLQVASRRWLETRFEQHGAPPPNIMVESNSSVSSLVSILQSTDLLTVISEITLRSEAGQGLAAVPLDDVTWHREIGIMTRHGSYQSPLAERLIEILRERARGR
jgi:DNA-binding transcriptional LysR family regulator